MKMKIISKIFLISLLKFCTISGQNDTDCIGESKSLCGDCSWFAFKDQKCFKLINEFQTKENADLTCKLKLQISPDLNPTLASISSNEEQDYLNEILFNKIKVEEPIWLGAIRQNGEFYWKNYLQFTYKNWAENNPVNEIERGCVEMRPPFSLKFKQSQMFSNNKGNWYNVICQKRNLVLCQKEQELSLKKLNMMILENRIEINETNEKLYEIKEENQNLKNKFNLISTEYLSLCALNQNWVLCKLFKEDNKNKIFTKPKHANEMTGTWSVANDICKKYNASLFSVETQEKQNNFNEFVEKFNLEKFEAQRFWTSGRRREHLGKTFYWYNTGHNFNYTNWAQGEPDNGDGEQYCVTIREDFTWDDDYCDAKRSIICEILI